MDKNKVMENYSKYDFEAEILKIPSYSKKVSLKTAKEKVSQIFQKYDELLRLSIEAKETEEKNLRKWRNIAEAHQTGIIEFKGGFFKISEISSIKINETNIVVNLKNQNNISLSKDFYWIERLFSQ